MLPRDAAPLLHRLAAGFPILTITGPRQSGKSTLARSAFPRHAYISLEEPDVRALALADPRRFLARFEHGVVLDEVQRAPDLLSYLQVLADARARPGEFVLTGSQQFGLLDRVSQSLAGRAGLVQLLPFAHAELRRGGVAPASLEAALWHGGYPALYDERRRLDPPGWFAGYVATYLERDVRQMLAVDDLALFQRFVSMCAARTAQLLNLNALASDCGISQPTARRWLTVLQASWVATLVPPYHRNFGKRLVKTPKLYFLDSGLACWLLGIRDAATLLTHPLRGPLFETWVVAEVLKHRFNRGLPADLCFWRDNHGHEVDLLFESDGRLQAVELKSGATFTADWTAPARRFAMLAQAGGCPTAKPIVVWGGEDSFTLDAAEVLSWRSLG